MTIKSDAEIRQMIKGAAHMQVEKILAVGITDMVNGVKFGQVPVVSMNLMPADMVDEEALALYPEGMIPESDVH